MLRQALTRPQHLVHKTKRRAKGRKHQSKFFTLQRGQKTVSHTVFAVRRRGKETPLSDIILKYPLWQDYYLQGRAETRPELLKSKISAAEQVISLRLKQLATTTDTYEEQIALAAALKSLKFLTER
jgi:hypothetical protein